MGALTQVIFTLRVENDQKVCGKSLSCKILYKYNNMDRGYKSVIVNVLDSE